LCMKVFYELKVWIETRESASIMFQDPNELWTTGMTRKYKAQLFRFTRKLGYFVIPPKQQSSFALKGGHVEEPLYGLNKDVAVVDFAGMYPSIMMRWNICPSASKQTLWNIPAALHKEFEKVVIPIERDLYDLPAYYEVPDNFNLCKDDLEEGEEEEGYFLNKDDKGNVIGYNKEYILDIMNKEHYDIELLESYVNMICETYRVPRFHKGKEEMLIMYINQERPGVVPQILATLKKERAGFKAEVKKYKKLIAEAELRGDLDKVVEYTIMRDIYDRRQDAIKVLMNSIYGIYGTREGNFGFMEGSAAVTHYGRSLIAQVNDYLVKNGCTIVYGDTDSSFFKFNEPPAYKEAELSDLPEHLRTSRDADTHRWKLTELNRKTALMNKANELVHMINTTVLLKPTEIELEKIMDVICLTKKKYIGMKTVDEGKICDISKLLIRGVAPVRGDTLPFVKIVYQQLITLIFDASVPRSLIVSYYLTQMDFLLQGKINKDDLVLSKTLNQSYSSITAPMNVYSRYLTKSGDEAQPGTKLSFLVVKATAKNENIGARYRPINTAERIDYEYYARIAKRPLFQLLCAAELDKLIKKGGNDE